jgi:hypothetical protein
MGGGDKIEAILLIVIYCTSVQCQGVLAVPTKVNYMRLHIKALYPGFISWY